MVCVSLRAGATGLCPHTLSLWVFLSCSSLWFDIYCTDSVWFFTFLFCRPILILGWISFMVVVLYFTPGCWTLLSIFHKASMVVTPHPQSNFLWSILLLLMNGSLVGYKILGWQLFSLKSRNELFLIFAFALILFFAGCRSVVWQMGEGQHWKDSVLSFHHVGFGKEPRFSALTASAFTH